MVKTIIRREFLDNLISFKFIACVLVAVVLVSISTAVLTNDYKDRLEDYNKGVAIAQESMTKVPVYSYLEVGIFKRPSPLSIFVSGIEGKTGNHVYLTHREIPTSLKGGLVKNEFAQIFSFFDLSSVVVVIFTILIILLSYDSVSGEKEDGVLSLVLSNSVARYKFLLGKYIGGLVSILVPLTFCFIVAVLIVLFSKGVEVNSEFFYSMFLLYLFSILYLSSVLLIGLFVSSKTKTSFNSLLFLLAFYLITVFLLPVTVRSYAERTKIRKAKNYENSVNELIREKNKETRKAYVGVPVRRSWASMSSRGNKVIFKRINPEETIEFYKRYYSLREKIREDYAIEAYELKRKDFRLKENIRNLQNVFLAFLPPSNFERTAELTAGTGLDTQNRFVQQLTLYWHQYVRYLHEKDAFSLKYFFPGPEKLTPEEMELIKGINEALTKREVFWTRSEAYQKAQNYNPDIEYLNLNDLPVFNFHRQSSLGRIKSLSLNIIILFFYNLLIFTFGHFSFSRYDPRIEF